jgi:methylenetetrahydrofolate--tRNA-(uracil-5-)-methyltransferase
VHTQRHPENYQPSNITWSHVAPWDGPRLQKRAKYQAMAERGLRDLAEWQRGLTPIGALAAATP